MGIDYSARAFFGVSWCRNDPCPSILEQIDEAYPNNLNDDEEDPDNLRGFCKFLSENSVFVGSYGNFLSADTHKYLYIPGATTGCGTSRAAALPESDDATRSEWAARITKVCEKLGVTGREPTWFVAVSID